MLLIPSNLPAPFSPLIRPDFYYLITEPIISRDGEIYQYVGDEISVTWNKKTGTENNNCIRCFFNISDVIEKNSDFYISKYGVAPEFKAGFHYGETVIGEIGVIKSEIVFQAMSSIPPQEFRSCAIYI